MRQKLFHRLWTKPAQDRTKEPEGHEQYPKENLTFNNGILYEIALDVLCRRVKGTEHPVKLTAEDYYEAICEEYDARGIERPLINQILPVIRGLGLEGINLVNVEVSKKHAVMPRTTITIPDWVVRGLNREELARILHPPQSPPVVQNVTYNYYNYGDNRGTFVQGPAEVVNSSIDKVLIALDNKAREADEIIATLEIDEKEKMALRKDMKEIIDAARRMNAEEYEKKMNRFMRYGVKVLVLWPLLDDILKLISQSNVRL